MIGDLVAALLSDALEEGFEIIAFEKGRVAALLADQQMLVVGKPGDKGLAAIGVMHALD